MNRSDFERNCAFLIHDTTRLMRRRLDLSIRDLGLTEAKWRVLVVLGREPGIRQSEIAERLGIEKAPLGTALETLERAGWIERRTDDSDRRARRVRLLPEAEPTLDLMNQRFRAVEANYLRGFDGEEILGMKESLRMIAEELYRAARQLPAAPLPESFLGLLGLCARLLNRRFDARLAELGYTRNQWMVLNTVSRHEGSTQTEIAKMTELGVAQLGKLVDALVRNGQLLRTANPTDRRANRLSLTPKTRHALSGIRERFESTHAALVRPLGETRKRRLVSGLGWIRQRLLEENLHPAVDATAGAR